MNGYIMINTEQNTAVSTHTGKTVMQTLLVKRKNYQNLYMQPGQKDQDLNEQQSK